MSNIGYSFLITTFAGLSTMLGAILIFFKFKNKDTIICTSLSFAAGVMLTISITDLIPTSLLGFLNKYYLFPSILLTLIFIIVGIIISILIKKYIPDVNLDDTKSAGLFKLGLISMIAIILHNIPEGIATFMTSTKNITLGLSLAIAITLHNIPEGISISVPIYYSTKSRLKALLYTFISGISEFIGAVIAYLFLAPYMNDFVMSILMSLIAGIMISISMYELIPSSLKYKDLRHVVKSFFIGVIFMGICHIFM